MVPRCHTRYGGRAGKTSVLPGYSDELAGLSTLARPPPALTRVGGLPQGAAMTLTEPPSTPLDSPAIAQALRSMGNPDPARLHCLCGRCRADDDYSFPELSLDACMTDVLRMVDIVECCTPEPHPGARVALHTLRELMSNARLLLCLQRQVARRGCTVPKKPDLSSCRPSNTRRSAGL